MAGGYLPALATLFKRNNVAISIIDFADKQTIGGQPTELVYTRTNEGHDGAVAETADLLALLLCLLQAIRPRTGDVAESAAGHKHVNRLARWLALVSTRFLPAAHRPRYLAEYAAELVELPRPQQLTYAMRAACRTWLLRRALTSSIQHVPARER
jgi:hypothetical protein